MDDKTEAKIERITPRELAKIDGGAKELTFDELVSVSHELLEEIASLFNENDQFRKMMTSIANDTHSSKVSVSSGRGGTYYIDKDSFLATCEVHLGNICKKITENRETLRKIESTLNSGDYNVNNLMRGC